jgi:hypothetical protein
MVLRAAGDVPVDMPVALQSPGDAGRRRPVSPAASATPSRKLWRLMPTAPISPMWWCCASPWSSSVAVSCPTCSAVIFSTA